MRTNAARASVLICICLAMAPAGVFMVVTNCGSSMKSASRRGSAPNTHCAGEYPALRLSVFFALQHPVMSSFMSHVVSANRRCGFPSASGYFLKPSSLSLTHSVLPRCLSGGALYKRSQLFHSVLKNTSERPALINAEPSGHTKRRDPGIQQHLSDMGWLM